MRAETALWEQGVPGSNPGIPTLENQVLVRYFARAFFFFAIAFYKIFIFS